MAAPVTVSSGENRDIELRLQERELHHIAGVIQVPEGKEHVGIIVKVSPNLRVLSPIAEVNLPKAGPFRIEGLDPGTYRVTAAGTGFPPFTANQIVELTNRDVEDLRLNLRVGVGVRAVVTMAEQNVETPGDLRFEPDALFAGLRAVIKLPQDHLSSSGYPPGEYWPVISVPKGYAVTSVTFNGQPVVNTCIDLEAPESTVNVVLTSRPSGIAGISAATIGSRFPRRVWRCFPNRCRIHSTGSTAARSRWALQIRTVRFGSPVLRRVDTGL